MKNVISVSTTRHLQLRDITRQVEEVVSQDGIQHGLCIVFCPHTTAGLVINENADPDVVSDLERAFAAMVPDVSFDHAEGNSPSHFLSSVTRPSLQLIVENSRLQLGRWQGIFFCEFDGPRERKVWVKILSD
jgi:secondary thiamine-phosphate synthase enzyme